MTKQVRIVRGASAREILARLKREHRGEEVVVFRERTVGNEVELEVAVPMPAAPAPAPALALAAMPPAPVPAAAVPAPARDESLFRERAPISDSLSWHGLSQGISARLRKAGPMETNLRELFQFEPRFPLAKRVIALVGPPGAGKTTTIAKLAAHVVRSGKLRCGLVTTDRYRIGAREHLENYSTLLKLPIVALESREPIRSQFPRILRELGRCDIVFVDTAGIAHHEKSRLEEAAEWMDGLDWIERWLVLPATSHERALRSSAEAFAVTNPERLVVTKLDESGFLGPVLNVASRLSLPFAFYGTGQRVPEDIEPASARRLAWLLKQPVQ